MGLLALYRLRGDREASERIDLTGKQVSAKALWGVFAAVYFVSSRDRIRYNDSQRARHERMW